ncbi:unnamed protein product [Prunus armeniaca]|uniref:Uncharacterized protein n=1 Tax=Prunus armeniaca TaxID=36596 RepID=A0A6J5X8B2_PRUAR|nr:unnamed protein product [Prunus armeniaca]
MSFEGVVSYLQHDACQTAGVTSHVGVVVQGGSSAFDAVVDLPTDKDVADGSGLYPSFSLEGICASLRTTAYRLKGVTSLLPFGKVRAEGGGFEALADAVVDLGVLRMSGDGVVPCVDLVASDNGLPNGRMPIGASSTLPFHG